jgi:hypothetical protein
MDSDPATPVTESDAAPAPSVPRAVPRRDILSVKFACGACGQHIEAPRDLFGEVMPCPACGALHQIPDVKNAPRSFPVKRIVPIRPRP